MTEHLKGFVETYWLTTIEWEKDGENRTKTAKGLEVVEDSGIPGCRTDVVSHNGLEVGDKIIWYTLTPASMVAELEAMGLRNLGNDPSKISLEREVAPLQEKVKKHSRLPEIKKNLERHEKADKELAARVIKEKELKARRAIKIDPKILKEAVAKKRKQYGK